MNELQKLETILTLERAVPIRELSKILKDSGTNIGTKQLFAKLRNGGYLVKRKGVAYNAPTQMSIDLGLFTFKTTIITYPNDERVVRVTTKVTTKGQTYFINKFLDRNYEIDPV